MATVRETKGKNGTFTFLFSEFLVGRLAVLVVVARNIPVYLRVDSKRMKATNEKKEEKIQVSKYIIFLFNVHHLCSVMQFPFTDMIFRVIEFLVGNYNKQKKKTKKRREDHENCDVINKNGIVQSVCNSNSNAN